MLSQISVYITIIYTCTVDTPKHDTIVDVPAGLKPLPHFKVYANMYSVVVYALPTFHITKYW